MAVNCSLSLPAADTVAKWGKLSLAEVLAPAIEMAEEGFPISPVTSFFWGRRAAQLASQAHGAVGCHHFT